MACSLDAVWMMDFVNLKVQLYMSFEFLDTLFIQQFIQQYVFIFMLQLLFSGVFTDSGRD